MTAPNLSADRPLTDPSEDLLGYAPFAKALAQAILNSPSGQSLVIGLHGEWGLGKTTVLNFCESYLQKELASRKPIVIRFNPWWFSGRDDLVRQFFAQLELSFAKWKTQVKGLGKLLGDLGEAVGDYPGFGLAKLLGRLRPRTKDPADLKDRISNLLSKQPQKIVVVIDDVDRLAAEEIRELFGVIKAVADFPNVVYVVAFDRQLVTSALTNVQGTSGEDYLEKIVQASFYLPPANQAGLFSILSKRLDEILAGTPSDLFNVNDWGNMYHQGIKPFLRTPRDVVRLANFVSIAYPPVKGEVNFVDFLGIEALRVFSPSVYEVIRSSPEMFAGGSTASGAIRENPERKFHDDWLSKVRPEDQEAVKSLVQSLFPRLKSVWSNWMYGNDQVRAWKVQRRIAAPQIFPVYFQLAPPSEALSRAEIQTFLDAAKDSAKLSEMLTRYSSQRLPAGATKARLVLEEIQDYTKTTIPLESIPSILKSLFDVGDEIEEADGGRRGMMDYGIGMEMDRIIFQLVRRVDKERRVEMVMTAGKNARGLGLYARFARFRLAEHEREEGDWVVPEDKRLLSFEDAQRLIADSIERIRRAAEEGRLIQSRELPVLLAMWRTRGNDGEAKAWAQSNTESDAGLVAFLELFLTEGFSHTMGDSVGRKFHRLHPKSLEPYFDLDALESRLSKLDESGTLEGMSKVACNQFLREYKLMKAGKDVDGPLSLLELEE